MDTSFILSCESTIDLPYSYCEARGIPVLFYSYQVDGVSYEDDMGRDPAALPRFYGFLDEGKLPTTAQLNEFQYESFFDALLQQGDVLHIAFGSGMTASVQNAMLAAESLREKYPERKLVVIDSLCSSSGYGLLVDGAADLRDAGKSMDEIGRLDDDHAAERTPSVLLHGAQILPPQRTHVRRGRRDRYGARHLPDHAAGRQGPHHRLR